MHGKVLIAYIMERQAWTYRHPGPAETLRAGPEVLHHQVSHFPVLLAGLPAGCAGEGRHHPAYQV